jgi:site-specific DNA-methyltransferase (adenine-specific)
MTRCKEFYDKWEECGSDWCEKAASSVSEINAYLGLVHELEKEGIPREFAFANFKENAARPIYRSRKDEVKRKALSAITDRLKKRVHLNDGNKDMPFETKLTHSEVQSIVNEIERAPHKEEMKKRGEMYADSATQLICADFLADYKQLEPESVDCIITDPPYVKEWLDNYDRFALAAEYVLKPGGFLISYVGHIHLDRILSDMTTDLEYFWIACLLHKGTTSAVHSRSVQCGMKPILIMNKPPRAQPKRYFGDVIQGTGREKSAHEWQQGEEELRQLIEPFTDPGDIILDPFMGSGTVLAMAKKMKRRAIGFDINQENVDVVKGRLVA